VWAVDNSSKANRRVYPGGDRVQAHMPGPTLPREAVAQPMQPSVAARCPNGHQPGHRRGEPAGSLAKVRAQKGTATDSRKTEVDTGRKKTDALPSGAICLTISAGIECGSRTRERTPCSQVVPDEPGGLVRWPLMVCREDQKGDALRAPIRGQILSIAASR